MTGVIEGSVYRHSSIFIFVAAFAWTMTAFAQGTTGAVAGRIVDAQGLAVPGVTVTVTGPQGAKTVVTDAEGRFRCRS